MTHSAAGACQAPSHLAAWLAYLHIGGHHGV